MAGITGPLTDLLRKGTLFEWGKRQQTAFDELRNFLTSPPVLRIADPSRPFEVLTDASDFAIGAILLQDFGDGLQPIAYESRKLQAAERNYPVHDKEMLAIVHAFKVWRCYLTGADVTVRTDHKSLQYLRAQPNLNPRQIRWLDFLESNFHCTITYKRGANNIADALTRPSAHLASIISLLHKPANQPYTTSYRDLLGQPLTQESNPASRSTMAAPSTRVQAAVVLTLLLSALVTPPASALRLGMRAQVLASISGPLVLCGTGEMEGTAQLQLVRRGMAVFLAYNLNTHASTRPSSKPKLLTANPCPSSSSSSASSTATTASLSLDPSLSTNLGTSLSTNMLNTTANAGAGASATLLNTSAGVGAGVGVSLPTGTVAGVGSLSASTGLMNTSAGVGAGVGVSLPNGTVSAKGDLSASTGLMNTSAGVGTSVGVSLPNGTVAAAGGVSASTGLLNTSAGVGAGVGVSLPNGTLSGSASLGASSPLLNTSAGVGAGVNAGSGGVQANLGASAGLGGSVSGLISGVGGAVGNLVGSVGNMAGSAGNMAGSMVGSVGNMAGSMVGSVGNMAGSMVGSVGNMAGSMVGSVGNMAGSVFVSLSPMAVLNGGWVATSAGTFAMVGRTRVSAAVASAMVARISTNMPLFLEVQVGMHQRLVANMK
ncbi:hypothetical protein CLOP_g7243 [Closterium sp. NIES-67]|nr:hypothetical protein CLOP_g7243 [Closterium sp. NIES-67]